MKFNKLYKEILENNIAGGAGSVFNSGSVQAGQYGNQFPSQNDQAYAPGDARFIFPTQKKKKKAKRIKIQRRSLIEANEGVAGNTDENYNYGFPTQWRAIKTKEGFNLCSRTYNTPRYIAIPYKTGWKISNSNVDEYFKDKGKTLHREDGPASESRDGRKEYWINGKNISYEEFLAIQKVNNPDDRGTMIDLLDI